LPKEPEIDPEPHLETAFAHEVVRRINEADAVARVHITIECVRREASADVAHAAQQIAFETPVATTDRIAGRAPRR